MRAIDHGKHGPLLAATMHAPTTIWTPLVAATLFDWGARQTPPGPLVLIPGMHDQEAGYYTTTGPHRATTGNDQLPRGPRPEA